MDHHTVDQQRDRISELPDEILHRILSFLTTTKLAVQTSVVSSRWRHLWKFTSTIYFDSFPYRPLGMIDYTFVDRTLNYHRSLVLQKFSIASTVRGDLYTNLVQNWITFALARHVGVLVLDFRSAPLPDIVFDFPPSFYTHNESLKQISLGCANLCPPLNFQGFSSLKSLRLWRCKLTDEILHEHLLKCKLLESLTIDRGRTLKKLKIFGPPNMRLKHFTFVSRAQQSTLVELDAPNLVSLKYIGSLGRISLGRNLPCLVEAQIFHDSSVNLDVDLVKALLDEKLSHVEILGVDYWFVRFLAKEYSTNGRHWTASKNLKNFCWFGPLNKEYDLSNLLAFLADCPLLESIKIYSRDYDRDGFTKTEYTYGFKNVFDKKLQDGKIKPSVGFLYKLRKVEFLYFSGYESEMELIKRLLQKAVVLESIILTYEEPKSDASVLQKELYQKEIACLPRASAHCRILFR